MLSNGSNPRALGWLFVALLLAQAEPSPAAAPDDAPIPALRADATAPAVVLEDRLEVSIDAAGLHTKRTWKVRVEDPERTAAGIPAPAGLAGATDHGARVLERLLVVPSATAAGAVFVLSATRHQSNGPFSGEFASVTGLPVHHAVVTVRSSSPHLTAWADPGADRSFVTGPPRTARFTWSNLSEDDRARAAFSTHQDWQSAGESLRRSVDAKMPEYREQLGHEIAAASSGLSVSQCVRRVQRAVRLREGQSGSFTTARSIAEIVDSREGTAAERALVLIALLRQAGHDAQPALARPASAGAIPLSIPAPDLLEHPAVAVQTSEGVVWLDPASDHVAVPDLPVLLLGGAAWRPGDVPVVLGGKGPSDGALSISANVTVAPDGSSTWTARLEARGAAREWLRRYLGPLEDAERVEVLRRMMASGHPNVDRFGASADGLDDPDRPLGVTIQAHESATMMPAGGVLLGELGPMLAPALAAWLPAGLAVHEQVTVSVPSGLQPMGPAAPVTMGFRPDALASVRSRLEGPNVVLVTEVQRRPVPPHREAASEAFIHEQARPMPILAAPLSVEPAQLRGLAPGEADAVEALMWWRADQPARARRVVTAAVRANRDLVGQFDRFAPAGDPRPWVTLRELDRSESTALRILAALERRGDADTVRAIAEPLTRTGSPSTRLQAISTLLRVQPAEADDLRDDFGEPLWRDPRGLLEAAGVTYDEAVPESSALAWLVRAEAELAAGGSVRAVQGAIDHALAEGTNDARLLSRAARVEAAVDAHARAATHAFAAATCIDDDGAAWQFAADEALRSGDLIGALAAARRRFDAEPGRDAAEQLVLLGTLASDRGAAQSGAAHGVPLPTAWPPTLDAALELAPEYALLAVLDHYDHAVVADADRLSLRARLRLEAGDTDGAARDGTLLATRHGRDRGDAIVFAATVGRLWATAPPAALRRAAQADAVASAIRLEWALLTGAADPLEEVRRHPADPRAAIIADSIRTPDAAAERAGWPGSASEPKSAVPLGFRLNSRLGAARGVWAASDPERGLIVVRASSAASLPPPLGALYSTALPPLASFPWGQVVRLDGGPLPVFAAIAYASDGQTIGLGFTVDAALDAIAAAGIQ